MALLESRAAARCCGLAEALRRNRRAICAAAVASCAISVLALTGSLYALKIYNVVVPARDLSALGGLTLAMLALYTISGLLDALRFKLLSGAAARLDRDLSAKVFAAGQNLSLGAGAARAPQPVHDLEQIRNFLDQQRAGGVCSTCPSSRSTCSRSSCFSPLMGALAVAGAVLLIVIVASVEVIGRQDDCRRPAQRGQAIGLCSAATQRSAGAIRAMGFLGRASERWCALNAQPRRSSGEEGAARQRRDGRHQGGAPRAAIRHAGARRLSGDQRPRLGRLDARGFHYSGARACAGGSW